MWLTKAEHERHVCSSSWVFACLTFVSCVDLFMHTYSFMSLNLGLHSCILTEDCQPPWLNALDPIIRHKVPFTLSSLLFSMLIFLLFLIFFVPNAGQIVTDRQPVLHTFCAEDRKIMWSTTQYQAWGCTRRPIIKGTNKHKDLFLTKRIKTLYKLRNTFITSYILDFFRKRQGSPKHKQERRGAKDKRIHNLFIVQPLKICGSDEYGTCNVQLLPK